MVNELIGRRIKGIWIDDGNTKVIIGKLVSIDGGLITIQSDSGVIFVINQPHLVSLIEYRGEWK